MTTRRIKILLGYYLSLLFPGVVKSRPIGIMKGLIIKQSTDDRLGIYCTAIALGFVRFTYRTVH